LSVGRNALAGVEVVGAWVPLPLAWIFCLTTNIVRSTYAFAKGGGSGVTRNPLSSQPLGPLAMMAGGVNDGEDMDGLPLDVITDSIREPERI